MIRWKLREEWCFVQQGEKGGRRMGGKEGVAADCASGDCMCWKEQSHPQTLSPSDKE